VSRTGPLTDSRPVARRRLSPFLSALLAGGVAAAVAAACTSNPTTDVQSSALPTAPGSVVPSGTGFFVDLQTPAAAQVQEWDKEGRTDDAKQLTKIAKQPLPLWASGDVAQVEPQTREYVSRAEKAGQKPLLVAYNIPHRDCGSFSGGGAPNGDYYRNWINGLASAVRGSSATVVLEPDAVPHEISGCVDGSLRDERYLLLGEAVDSLRSAGAAVYLDAGNPGFIADAGAIAAALDRSGVKRADGFALNVANFFATEDSVAYGEKISADLGGTHFIVDTSRNGQGKADESEIDGAPAFCNPPGRGLGAAPTMNTGNELVDALLWIKRPGESDGACRPGEPAAGQWYPDYALGLARRAA
jgi:endoglucanase